MFINNYYGPNLRMVSQKSLNNSNNKRKLGKWIEDEVCHYLQNKGLILITVNYHSHYGEIDLIMRDQEYLVFIEVRMRNNISYAHSIESVTLTKQKKIIKTATLYLQKQKLLNKIPCRFDIVGVAYQNEQLKFDWIKNAFQGS